MRRRDQNHGIEASLHRPRSQHVGELLGEMLHFSLFGSRIRLERSAPRAAFRLGGVSWLGRTQFGILHAAFRMTVRADVRHSSPRFSVA